jgi:hypothetical protein
MGLDYFYEKLKDSTSGSYKALRKSKYNFRNLAPLLTL